MRPTNQRERLARIRRFDQLVCYLRDELGWPIESDDFEELTFEFTPEELGIDAKNAANIREIKRLRPLAVGQPWGIFFVKFEPKRLPVVALRRILGRVAIKKRAPANQPVQRAWAADDLLFVSSYGEGDERHIAFAHFSKARDSRDLPTLKVLGWDNQDTLLHLDDVASKLTNHLTWPEDGADTDAWRERWRAAFKLRHGEVISTSKELYERLASLARAIRDTASAALAIETEKGPLIRLMEAFRTALVHDLDKAGFADMYAQTIAYGLLSTRITDPGRSTADDLAKHMGTNPFLRELMETFLTVGGRRGEADGPGIDFDELGVSEVVELLDCANMEAVVRDFGDRNPSEDPVIHFYEDFLAAYDKEQKVRSGVFYTPRPVVSYIVRSVDELLRRDFGLALGLADTTTWQEMTKRHVRLKIPKGTSPDQAFVQILDPATGTGTFLVEVIDLIHSTMTEKWKAQGHSEHEIKSLWNEYVPNHLLPRLHGYELLIAPFTIAHLKIGLKLYETGYRFTTDERARVYLTNALEPPGDDPQLRFDFLPALAHEAQAVNAVKQNQRFTIVIGNPPYLGEAGRGGKWIAALMRGKDNHSLEETLSYFKIDGKPIKERNQKWVNDLYVRFTRLSHRLLEQTGTGVHGFITNHGYLDGPTFRGMRWALMSSFDQLYLLDLHGNLKKKDAILSRNKDENVFEIEQGVSIGLFVKTSSCSGNLQNPYIRHAHCWGSRLEKYSWFIANAVSATNWEQVNPRDPFYLFVPFSGDNEHYERWTSVRDIFRNSGTGVITKRDALSIHYDSHSVWNTVTRFAQLSDENARICFDLPPDVRDWRFDWAQKDILDSGPSKSHIKPILYRLFDSRFTYYTGRSRGFIGWPVIDIMGHMIAGDNLALISCRQQARKGDEWAQVFVTSQMAESCSTSNVTREINYLFPLYIYPGVGKNSGSMFDQWPGGRGGRTPNFESEFVGQLATHSQLCFVSDGYGDLEKTFGPEDILAWIYAIFHSPNYREHYEAYLKLDFPRVPHSGGAELFRQLVKSGHDLLALHLLESPRLDTLVTSYRGIGIPEVGRVGWAENTVWLNAEKTDARAGQRAIKPGTIGFGGVSEEVWDFRIGSYQVCYKWLKDRRGRRLSHEDIVHYQRIVVALSETIRIMSEIDEVIEVHGGWPNAFQSITDSAS